MRAWPHGALLGATSLVIALTLSCNVKADHALPSSPIRPSGSLPPRVDIARDVRALTDQDLRMQAISVGHPSSDQASQVLALHSHHDPSRNHPLFANAEGG
jgi:hypothetical protein